MNDNENKTNAPTIKLPVRYDGVTECLIDADGTFIAIDIDGDAEHREATAGQIVTALNTRPAPAKIERDVVERAMRLADKRDLHPSMQGTEDIADAMVDFAQAETANLSAQLDATRAALGRFGIYELNCQCCSQSFYGESDNVRCSQCCISCRKVTKDWEQGEQCPARKLDASK